MLFEERVLRGVSIRTYTHLLTSDRSRSACVEVGQKQLRVPLAERINANVIKLKRH